jgi:hypothetical protein
MVPEDTEVKHPTGAPRIYPIRVELPGLLQEPLHDSSSNVFV